MRSPTSLVIQKTQIETTMRYHYLHIECLKLKRLIIPTSINEDMEKLEYTTGGNIKW